VEPWSAGSIRMTASLQYSNTPTPRRQLKFIWLALCALLSALSFPVQAQQAKNIPRIAYLGIGSPQNPGPQPTPATLVRLGGLRRGLRELGYEEGKNIIIEYRTAAGQRDRIPGIVAELAQLQTDVIVWSATQEDAKEIKTIPIVYVGTTDFVATGLVKSLARPGGNITGITSLAPDLGGKRLELLKETVPKLSKVALLFDPASSANAIELEQLRGPAAGLGITLRTIELRGSTDIEKAFSTMIQERVAGLSTASGPANNTNRIRITELAAKNRLPAIYHESLFVEGGGLMSYGANLADMFHRAATHVDKILKGAKPADIPVEQPTKFELVVNLKAAKQIGLTIPPNVLARADKVIR
jgi:putative tryptophan/tyrosine transport system substrate-binding protein